MHWLAFGYIVSAQVDMHTYQCFGDFWNAVHNDDAGKGLHYDVSCAYAYEVGGISLKNFDVLERFETDTIGRSLENGAWAMAAPGTGLTPPMYRILRFFPNENPSRWSSSGCGCLLRWMPMNILRRAQAGFSGAPKSR